MSELVDVYKKPKHVTRGLWLLLVVIPSAHFYGSLLGSGIRGLLEWAYS